MASPNLNITEVSANQTQKEVTINNAIAALDNAMNSALSVTVTAGDTTLTSPQFRGYVLFKATGSPSGALDLNVPASIKRLFAVQNDSGQDVLVQVTGGAGAGVTVPDGSSFMLYSDGADVLTLGGGGGGGGSSSYKVSPFVAGAGVDENKTLSHVFAETVVFPDNFSGSQAYAATTAGSSTVITIKKNGSSIGTLTFASATATGVFATTGSGDETFAPGDRIDFTFPSNFNSLAGIAITMLGVL